MRFILQTAMAVVAIGLLSLDVAMPAAHADEGSDVEQGIRQLENDLRTATLTNDPKSTGRLLADDWVNINANGTVTNKEQLLKLIDSFIFRSIYDEEVHVRIYGDTAIVTGISTRVLASAGDKDITRKIRFTRVWVKQDGPWRVVTSQATPIPE